MVAYSFKKRFAEPILLGTKAQTIRADRKRHARPGETVQLYVGQRTKHCRKLGEARCIAVERVLIEFAGRNGPPSIVVSTTEGELVRRATWANSLNEFARQDGFGDFAEMTEFWAANHPGQQRFEGVLVRWQPLTPADPLDIGAVT